MGDFINKIEVIRRIDKRIKVYEEETLSFMTKSEMRYIRQKCDEGKPISNNELMRYSRAVSAEEKILK